MPKQHHHHENKRDKANTRAEQVVKRKRECGTAILDRPMPLIDIGIGRVEELIKSITGVFEDDYQDAWVAVLEQEPATENEVLEIARKVRHSNNSKRLTIKCRNISLAEQSGNREGTTLTLEGTLAIPSEGTYSPRILKQPKESSRVIDNSTPILSQNRCQYCSSSKIRRYGIRYGKRGFCQRLLCYDCGRVFTANGAEGKMQYPNFIIREFISLRIIGHSFCRIQKQLEAKYNVKLSTGTLYSWGKRFGVAKKFKDMRYRKDKDQLILSLKKLERNTALSKDDILTICGYSQKTKIEDTLLVKLGLLTKTKTGWLINEDA